MQFPYDTKLVLPLSVAHQIQSLLQHAIALESKWMSNNNSFNILHKLEVPDVGYFDHKEPTYDATTLSKQDVQVWIDEMTAALKENDVTSASKDLLSPENWKKLKVPS